MTVGRSRTCDIVIPSAKVSRQHASLSLTGIDLFIEDLGSANGVWLNGEKITRTRVSEGDVYTISDETLSFSMR
ncbi:MAG: FHA domain-containing protein [Deltaproteobacteria bacterium]|nr:FHA domain-containing protein [Deltaproteobacteria bacterium]